MIFVLGSGRSGTHWLGHILESHPKLHVTIEDPRWFAHVTQMAMDATTRPALFPSLIAAYRDEASRVAPLQFADKSHPNIWLAETLADALPGSKFVGIQRDPWGTVASMLQHAGVSSWHDRWRDFPVPNHFLGITEELAQVYNTYSVATKSALRWRSHNAQMLKLQTSLGNRLLVLHYDTLFTDPDRHLASLAAHLELAQPFPPVVVKADSLQKWRSQLTSEQLIDIQEVVGFQPPT